MDRAGGLIEVECADVDGRGIRVWPVRGGIALIDGSRLRVSRMVAELSDDETVDVAFADEGPVSTTVGPVSIDITYDDDGRFDYTLSEGGWQRVLEDEDYVLKERTASLTGSFDLVFDPPRLARGEFHQGLPSIDE